MKVIHLISGGDSGGAKTHVHSLLSGLSKFIQADMICFTNGPFVDQARELGIHVTVIEGHNLPAVFKRLKKEVLDGGYDVVHCHGARGNLMGALLHRSIGLPVVTTVHSDPKLDYMGRLAARLTYGITNEWALRHIPYHIGVSDAMVDLLIDRNIIRRNFFAIYNGIDFTPVPPQEDRLPYLRSLGMDVCEDSVVIGIAARMNPVKDMSTLVRGFAAGYAQCPNLRLVIAGDGEEHEKLAALAKDLGVERYVTFAGWISGMDRFYSALDINALTSLSETFPYALTEGARHHLATVATAVGGIPNLIEDGVNGFLISPGDSEALGRYFAMMGNDADLRRRLGQRMYEIASTRFSLDKTIETQIKIYEKILSDSARDRKKRTGVVICGAYGRGNMGDEAILKSIITELHTIDPEMPICAMTRNPRQARKDYRVESVYTFNFPAYRKRMAESRLYINGGGSLIQNITSRRSLWFYLRTLKTAKQVGAKVMMYGCGIGPVRNSSDRAKSAEMINRYVDVITLRDRDSMSELQSLGVTGPKIVLAADPTVILPAASSESAVTALHSAGLHPEDGQRYLGITVRPWHGFEENAPVIARAAEYVYDTYGLIPVFLPIEARLDTKAAAEIAAHLEHTPHAILPGCAQPEQAIALFSQMNVVLSMRLHALIFAAVHGVPLVGMVYDPKVSAFLDSVGQDLYISFDKLSFEALAQYLDTAVARSSDRALLEEKARQLLDLERNNLLCASKLLTLS